MTTDILNARDHIKPQLAQMDDAMRDTVIKAHNERAQKDLKFFARTVNQGEWLSLTRQLEMTRAEIGDDDNLTLLALAWVKEKRAHGAASMTVLLEKTDIDLVDYHGFLVPPDPDDDEQRQPSPDTSEPVAPASHPTPVATFPGAYDGPGFIPYGGE